MSKFAKINIFESQWVDLVFKGRNQEYGAYVLRKDGDKNTTRGIVFAIVFFTMLITTPMIIDYIKGFADNADENVKVTEVVNMEEPPPIDKKQPPPPPVEPPPPLKSTVKFTPPEIKPDEQVPDEPPPAQDEMKDKDASTKTVEGNPDGVDASLLESGDGDNTGDAEPEIITFAEQMPEFGDNPSALSEFLARNINYPEMAKANGQEGKVIVQFVVGREGKISDITVVKKGGWGFDEAALEVVKKMPAWKPAKQNGKPVPLRMTLPIKFTLQN